MFHHFILLNAANHSVHNFPRMNRSIRRIIFYSIVKPTINEKGEIEVETISVSSALQIAGRAGRYGTQWEHVSTHTHTPTKELNYILCAFFFMRLSLFTFLFYCMMLSLIIHIYFLCFMRLSLFIHVFFLYFMRLSFIMVE